jgi:hypothetical protein
MAKGDRISGIFWFFFFSDCHGIFPAFSPQRGEARVTIRVKGGQLYTKQVDVIRGSPDNPSPLKRYEIGSWLRPGPCYLETSSLRPLIS